MDTLVPLMPWDEVKIRLPRPMRLHSVTSPSLFDHEERTFFSTSHYQWGCCIMTFAATFNAHNSSAEQSATFPCIFYAMKTCGGDLLCSIIDERKYPDDVYAVEAAMMTRPRPTSVLYTLRRHRIPRASAVAVEIADTQQCALVSFEVGSIASGPDGEDCLEVISSCEVFNKKDLVPIERRGWPAYLVE